MAKFILILTLLLQNSMMHYLVSAAGDWSYSDTNAWGQVNQVCSRGSRQSPINIETSRAVTDPNLANDPLIFERYNGAFTGEYLNNGYTLQFNINPGLPPQNRPRIYGGGLGAVYVFEQFHFHWGNASTACMGAEHLIDFRSAPAEIHFVHYNARYPSISEALKYSDGLAVIGFLFEPVGDSRLLNTDYVTQSKYIGSLATAGSKVSASMDFSKFVPPQIASTNNAKFYRYDGSLTTPPCAEVVTWTVYDYRVPILTSTLDEFRKLAFKQANKVMVNNFRPLQNLFSRTVRTNVNSGVPKQVPVWIFVILLAVIEFLFV